MRSASNALLFLGGECSGVIWPDCFPASADFRALKKERHGEKEQSGPRRAAREAGRGLPIPTGMKSLAPAEQRAPARLFQRNHRRGQGWVCEKRKSGAAAPLWGRVTSLPGAKTSRLLRRPGSAGHRPRIKGLILARRRWRGTPRSGRGQSVASGQRRPTPTPGGTIISVWKRQGARTRRPISS